MTSIAERQGAARALSPYESFFTVGSVTVWLTAHVRGALDQDALAGALCALRSAHPALSQQVALDETGFRFVSDEAEACADPVRVPGLSVREGSSAESLVLSPLTKGKGLVAVDAVTGGEQHWVSFGVHHGIADARLAMHYCSWFWAAYTQIVTTGSPPSPDPAPHPLPPEALLRARGVAELPSGGAQRIEGTAWGGKPTTLAEGIGGKDRRRIILDPQTTAALRAAGKARGVSMHGVVCGAIALAERSLVPAQAPEPVHIGFKTAVDVRERVAPAIGIAEATNLTAMAYSRVPVDEASDPFELGRHVVGDLAADLASGLVQQQIYHAAARVESSPALYVTNVGAFETLQTPDGLFVEDLRGSLEVEAAALARIAETGEGPRTDPGVASSYLVSAYLGRLSVEANYPGGSFTAQEADLLASRVEANLREMAKAA